MHKVPGAEDGDHCGEEEEKEAQLQPHRKHHIQLFLGGVLIAHRVAFGIPHRVVGWQVLDNNHNATVSKGHDPGDQNSYHFIQRLVGQIVLHGERHSQVALNADARQEL